MFAMVAFTFGACGETDWDEDENGDTPQKESNSGNDGEDPNYDAEAESKHSIAFTLVDGENYAELILLVENEADEEFVWLDRNGNGQKDDGERIKSFDGRFQLTDLPSSTPITLHGRITTFYIGLAGLETIDVSGNTVLKKLTIEGGDFAALDLSKNTQLVDLNLTAKKLTTLDLSHNPELKELEFTNVPLTQLDLSKNAQLERIDFTDVNHLVSLDLSGNPSLKFLLWGGYKPFESALSSINLSQCPDLEALVIFCSQLQTLDVTNNPKLKTLKIDGDSPASMGKIASLDLSQNSRLVNLSIDYNPIEQIDLSGLAGLERLSCYSTHLRRLDVSMLGNLRQFFTSNAPACIKVSQYQLDHHEDDGWDWRKSPDPPFSPSQSYSTSCP
ncbi:MAG: hypothetical protein CSA97_05650 [Bacteroidetes bacterium]|nr:MAG: hypothetical protein CSA97_05650 [Bacteroidota bacterium]